MADKRYSNRELDLYRDNVKETLDQILQQTTRTNGRVTSLETRHDTHNRADEERFGTINVDTAILKTKMATVEKLGWGIALATIGGLVAQFFDLI